MWNLQEEPVLAREREARLDVEASSQARVNSSIAWACNNAPSIHSPTWHQRYSDQVNVPMRDTSTSCGLRPRLRRCLDHAEQLRKDIWNRCSNHADMRARNIKNSCEAINLHAQNPFAKVTKNTRKDFQKTLKTLPKSTQVGTKLDPSWQIWRSSCLLYEIWPTSQKPWKTYCFLMILVFSLVTVFIALGSQLGSILGWFCPPSWSQIGTKMLLKLIQQAIKKMITFWIDFWPILDRFGLPTWPKWGWKKFASAPTFHF